MKKLKLTEILTISPVLSFLMLWKQVWRGNLMKSLQRKWLSLCKFWFLVSISIWSWKPSVSRHYLLNPSHLFTSWSPAQGKNSRFCVYSRLQTSLAHWSEQNALQEKVWRMQEWLLCLLNPWILWIQSWNALRSIWEWEDWQERAHSLEFLW